VIGTMLTIRGSNHPDGSFDWPDALIDAAVFAGANFFTGLGALFSQGALTVNGVGVVACAAMVEFLGILVAKRKIRKE